MMYTLLSVRWDNKFLMTNISKVLGFYEDILNEKHPMYHQKDNLFLQQTSLDCHENNFVIMFRYEKSFNAHL